MSEPPDFDAIALRLVSQSTALAQVAIVEQLRQVWNARGAADLASVLLAGVTVGGAQTIERAVRALDR